MSEALAGAADAHVHRQQLNDLLYEHEGDARLRPWCRRPTEWLADLAAVEIADRLTRQERVVVVDYGAGTGAATIALAAALRRRGLWRDTLARRVEIVLADIPGPWFAADDVRSSLGGVALAAVDLRARTGRVLPLDEALLDPVDLVVANMVFHLVPPKALHAAFGGVRRAMVHGALLVWTAPDLEHRSTRGLLFHDANRQVRAEFERLVAAGRVEIDTDVPVGAPVTITAASRALATKQIPDPPLSAAAVFAAFRSHFDGGTFRLATPITPSAVRRAALLSPNLRNLNEIKGDDHRRAVCEAILDRWVLPEMFADGATQRPLHWTVGAGRPR